MNLTRGVPMRYILLLALGFSVWCSALVLLYALFSLGCAFGWPATTLNVSMTVTFLVHLALLGILWRHYARTAPDPAFGKTGSFMHWVIAGTLIAAFVTTLFTLGSPLLLSSCM